MNDNKHLTKYSVKQLAELAGVSVRTLHLYDKIGLLKPSVRTDKRYRLYGDNELMRLQQILFYRELELPLKRITDILNSPDFDLLEALENHKRAIKARKLRLDGMLATIDKTILNLKGKIKMTHSELYAGLPKNKAAEWQESAREKWPDQTAHAEKQLLNMTKDEFQTLKDGLTETMNALAALRSLPPEADEVQAEIARHYGYIRQFWGRAGNIDAAYRGLGQLYVDEPAYTTVNDVPDKDFAIFMQAAMQCYVGTNRP